MNVVFDDDALDDLRSIFDWIAKDNRRAAENLVSRIFDKAEVLETPGLAEMGRPGLDPGTRELIEFPYIIVYEVREGRGEIVILAVVHGALDRDEDER
jgi:plasmid stabilization system protein ParE